MDILQQLYKKAKDVNEGLAGGSLVREVITRFEADVMELQRIQLLGGKSGSGEDMRPYYSEDLKSSGYFYSVGSAGRYADWKKGLQYPYSVQRNPDAPNLYINGKFHSELGVHFDADKMEVVGTTSYASGIVAKYGAEQFGLMWINWNEIFFNRGGYDALLNEVKKTIYG